MAIIKKKLLFLGLTSFLILATFTPASAASSLENTLTEMGFSTGSKSSELTRASCLARELFLDKTSLYKKLSLSEIESISTVDLTILPAQTVEGINVNLTCQYSYFVRDGKIKKFFPISSGRKGHETQPGIFKIWYQYDHWWESTLYPGAWMYRPKYFDHDRAFHGLKSDASVRPYPDSHGCLRTKKKMMDYLWSNMVKSDQIRIYGKFKW